MNTQNKQRLHFFKTLLLLVPLLLAGHTSTDAQPVDKAQVVVSYTYNFAKNIRWPNESAKKTFNIGLFQVSDKALANEFLKLNNAATIKSAPIRVRETRNIRTLKNYDLIFVGANDDKTVSQIQTLIEGSPILMVTSNYDNKRLVMINLFETKTQQVQFEVNKANLLNNNLTPLPELILLGGTEIDVAKLFRQGQSSLIKIQNQLSSQQQKLANLQSKINSQEENNTRLIGQMRKLNNDILNTKKLNTELAQELTLLEKTIEESRDIIKQQKTEITDSQNQKKILIEQVNQRNKELDQKQVQLLERQRDLDLISETITSKETELVELNSTINRQENELQSQRDSIEKLDELVSAQKRSLYFLWGLVAAGTTLFFVVIFAYRTKRRDNERLARRSHELQIARDKLEVAKRKAEAANRAKGAFLSLMSHELRTPLQSIIGYTDLIIEELKMEGDISYMDQLIRVNTNGERLLELINNTLDLAKIEAGKMKVELTPIHIDSLVEEAISNVKPLLAKNKNELKIDIDNNQYMPEVDYDKLLLMLVNLLSNATKFTKQGIITIDVKNTPQQLSIAVKDTGIGLTKEQLEYVFNRFHQVSHGGTKKFKGTGLGLSITQHFCEIMGGNIHAESNQDKGAAFIVDIPLPVVITEKKFIGIEGEEEVAA
ncbi:MAG: YfiR/HmsC family protein [Cellvibrionaceae bacterium]